MRSLLLLASLLTLAAAAPPHQRELGAWMQCLADQAERFARTAEPSEIAADAAMGACAAEEGALAAKERRSVSAAGREGLERAQRDGRAVIRQRVIARIVELRSAR